MLSTQSENCIPICQYFDIISLFFAAELEEPKIGPGKGLMMTWAIMILRRGKGGERKEDEHNAHNVGGHKQALSNVMQRKSLSFLHNQYVNLTSSLLYTRCKESVMS